MNSRQWFFSGVAFLLQIPFFAYGAGLVPCGGTGEPACQACYVLGLVNSVSSWLVGILSIGAAIMFMIAGFRILTAQGNPSVLKAAKDMIVNVAIGFAIVLAAWLLIDLLMRTLMNEPGGEIGPWNRIACVDQPSTTVVPGVVTIMQTTQVCTSVDDCAARAQQCESRPAGEATITNTGATMEVACNFASTDSGNHPPNLSGAGACDVDTVAEFFPGQVGEAQCVIGGESTCGASLVSRTDVMRNDGNRAFSFGPTQINITVHPIVGCGPTLNCPDAFNGRNYDAVVIDEDLYQACAAAVQDVRCGLRNSRRIYDDAMQRHGNGWQPWSAAGRDGCGLHNFY